MEIAILLNTEIEKCYRQFVDALKTGNLAVLEKIYAEDYLLVRPNGDILSKREILADLRTHHMLFTNYATLHLAIKVHGMVGILTTETISTAIRDGKEGTVHARQVAIFIKKSKVLTLTYFQSTNIVSKT
jgi:ketosteroid isomerase-like protein